MPTITSSAAVLSPRRPPTPDRAPTTGRRRDPLGRIDRAVEAALGADLRLIYGMAAPVLLVVAALVALFLSPSYWLVGAIVALELCCLGFVLIKVLAMLGEDEATEVAEPSRHV